MAHRLQFRRDTAARWAQYNPVLLEGEVGYVTDNPNQYKIGDGVHAWNDLPLRGYTGTISQELGNDEDSVISQKVVTKSIKNIMPNWSGEVVENPIIETQSSTKNGGKIVLAKANNGYEYFVYFVDGKYYNSWRLDNFGNPTDYQTNTYSNLGNGAKFKNKFFITNNGGIYIPSSNNNELVNLNNYIDRGYKFAGIVKPKTMPSKLDQNVFYIAYEPGVYVNFGNIIVSNYFTIIEYNGKEFFKKELKIPNLVNEKIWDILGALGSVMSFEEILLNEKRNGFYNISNFSFIEDNNFFTYRIYCDVGDFVWINSKSGGVSMAIVVMKLSDNSWTYLVSGDNKEHKIAFIVPSSAVEIYVCSRINFDLKVRKLENVKQIGENFQQIEKDVKQIGENFQQIEKDVKQIGENFQQIEKDVKQIGENFQPSINIWNGFVVEGVIDVGGRLSIVSSLLPAYSTDLIPIKPNHYYYISGRNGSINSLRCLGEDKETVYKVLSVNGKQRNDFYLPNTSDNGTQLNGQFKTPENASYVQVSLQMQGNGTWDKFMLLDAGEEYNPDYEVSEYVEPGFTIKFEKLPPYPDVEKISKKSAKVLLIGSSHGMNTISQFPWIAYKSGFNVTVGNVYRGSLTLQQIANSINNNESIGGWFKVFTNGVWSQESSTKFTDIVKFTNWDFIILQRSASDDEIWTEEQSNALDVIISKIQEICNNVPTILFSTGFADPNDNNETQKNKTLTQYNTALEMRKTFGIEVIPLSTCIQNARETSLSSLGNYTLHQLCYDSQHLDYGIGCYVAGCVLFEFIMRKFGFSVLNTIGYGTYNEVKTFVGNLVDSGGEDNSSNAYTEPTIETMRIAKYCAMIGINDPQIISSALSEKYPKN